jgi:hypothetical protein
LAGRTGKKSRNQDVGAAWGRGWINPDAGVAKHHESCNLRELANSNSTSEQNQIILCGGNLFLAEGILRVSFGSSSWARCAVIVVHWRELGVSLLSFWVV